MPKYNVTYQRQHANGTYSGGTYSTIVTASSASQAKEQIKARNSGNIKIISAVELK